MGTAPPTQPDEAPQDAGLEMPPTDRRGAPRPPAVSHQSRAPRHL